jgi:hypothetical protein
MTVAQQASINAIWKVRFICSVQWYDAVHTVFQVAKESTAYIMGLIVRSSAIHAAGCYTTTAVRKGHRVAEYTGLRLTKEEADNANEDSSITYLFGLGDGTVVIDGHCMAMFINHSCDPNCETREIRGRVWVTAIRSIAAGEEITYDYCLYDGGDDEAICNCGTRKCRGTMYAKTEIRRRKAAAKKALEKQRSKSTKGKTGVGAKTSVNKSLVSGKSVSTRRTGR